MNHVDLDWTHLACTLIFDLSNTWCNFCYIKVSLQVIYYKGHTYCCYLEQCLKARGTIEIPGKKICIILEVRGLHIAAAYS